MPGLEEAPCTWGQCRALPFSPPIEGETLAPLPVAGTHFLVSRRLVYFEAIVGEASPSGLACLWSFLLAGRLLLRAPAFRSPRGATVTSSWGVSEAPLAHCPVTTPGAPGGRPLSAQRTGSAEMTAPRAPCGCPRTSLPAPQCWGHRRADTARGRDTLPVLPQLGPRGSGHSCFRAQRRLDHSSCSPAGPSPPSPPPSPRAAPGLLSSPQGPAGPTMRPPGQGGRGIGSGCSRVTPEMTRGCGVRSLASPHHSSPHRSPREGRPHREKRGGCQGPRRLSFMYVAV